MRLELRIQGLELDVRHLLLERSPELILGRSEACDVQLADPERFLSRQHLAVWALDGTLYFRVLSAFKGVETPSRDVFPGGEGVLLAGEIMQVGPYTLSYKVLGETGSHEMDSADDLQNGWAPTMTPERHLPSDSELGPLTPVITPVPKRVSQPHAFGQTQVLRSSRPSALQAYSHSMPAETDISAFFRGLGLDPASVGALGPAELETVGRCVRTTVVGMLELMGSKAVMKEELGAVEGTMLAPKKKNPLVTDWPINVKLEYLFGGRAAAIGFIHPEVALREVLTGLRAHEQATVAATRAAIEGAVSEFEPVRLKARLLDGRGGLPLTEPARAWRLFTQDYQSRSYEGGWLQHVMDRHFMPTYVRESQEIRRREDAQSDALARQAA